MKKRILSLLTAAFVAALTICGCAGAPASGSGSEAASGSEVFKIGGIGPTTGAAAIYGSDVRDGIQIAVDEINANGGINGFQIDYKFEDDEHNAEKAVNAYNTLKDWGMNLLIGTGQFLVIQDRIGFRIGRHCIRHHCHSVRQEVVGLCCRFPLAHCDI